MYIRYKYTIQVATKHSPVCPSHRSFKRRVTHDGIDKHREEFELELIKPTLLLRRFIRASTAVLVIVVLFYNFKALLS